MEFLPQQNRRVGKEPLATNEPILASGKHVVVIGGGDTGSDCIGTSVRQGALSVTQLEIMPQPPVKENKLLTWPDWPLKLRTSSSHEEGAEREFAVMTSHFEGENGVVKKLKCVRVDGKMQAVPGSEFGLKADLVLLAMGFVSPLHEGMLQELGVAFDPRGNVQADTVAYASSTAKVYACGDMRRGQSLVVWLARGVGDPRRPPGRACDRQEADGRDGPAAVRELGLPAVGSDCRLPDADGLVGRAHDRAAHFRPPAFDHVEIVAVADAVHAVGRVVLAQAPERILLDEAGRLDAQHVRGERVDDDHVLGDRGARCAERESAGRARQKSRRQFHLSPRPNRKNGVPGGERHPSLADSRVRRNFADQRSTTTRVPTRTRP